MFSILTISPVENMYYLFDNNGVQNNKNKR